MAILTLPVYPTSRSRKSLTPSQLVNLNQLIFNSLSQCLTLPLENLDIPSAQRFISSYAKDVAARLLQAMIWDDPSQSKGAQARDDRDLLNMSQTERTTHFKVILLAEKLAGALNFETLVDLGVAYGSSNPKRLRTLCTKAYEQNTRTLEAQVSEAILAFTSLLESSAQGLYGLRKLSHILFSSLRPLHPAIKLRFARDKQFILALAKAYDQGLSLSAQSYGGFRFSQAQASEDRSTPLEDWERLFLDTKVALLDTFHILIRTLFDDVASVPNAGRDLAARSEPAFEIVFSLLELPAFSGAQTGSSSANSAPTPFLNRTLLADYQHAHDLSRTFVSVLRKADNERTQLLEYALQSLSTEDTNNSDPGILKLIIRSSGIPPGIDHKGRGPSLPPKDASNNAKGKGKASAVRVPTPDPILESAISQVLDILPDQPEPYVRYLLGHTDYPYKGNAERLIEALFEGTAPGLEEVEGAMAREAVEALESDSVGVGADVATVPVVEEKMERRNVFDEEIVDVSTVRYGKKETTAIVQDRSYMEQMKADILRRAEEAQYEDSEDEDDLDPYGDPSTKSKKGKDVAFEEELDGDLALEGGGVKVRDGELTDDEGSSDHGEDEVEGDDEVPKGPETILELAYLRDPKLFDRDAQTRRGKPRADLKAQTGWSDEQIEGWRIMLERNPRKDKILQKHEFRGNQPLPPAASSSSSQNQSRGGSSAGGRGGRGQGGRGRGGGGRGRGGGGREGGQGGGDSARDRQRKERRGNQQRKAGHDKKMARAGPPGA